MQKATAQNPELIAKWRSYGGELKAMTPNDFNAFIKRDNQLWGQAISGAGVKLD
jgi:tripartite-type tricarboxylate transporter receptor subunit TctC